MLKRRSRTLGNLPAFLLLALSIGCEAPAEAPPTPEPVKSNPVAHFVDRAPELGIDAIMSCGNETKHHIIEILGSGLAVADYDNDGDLDFYVATGQSIEDWASGDHSRVNSLYRNDGERGFTEVAAEAGVALASWTSGPYFVDYDNDGDKDLFLTRLGPNVLYRNEGNGRFVDVSDESGLGRNDEWSSSAAFGDLDGDGDLDLYVANYCKFDVHNPPFDGARVVWRGIEVLPGPQGLVPVLDRLYRNDGDGRFTDVSEVSGIHATGQPRFGLGVVMSDLDADGDLEVYVANDSVKNSLWRNDGQLKFKEIATQAGVATNEDSRDQAGMGTDAADYDGDGNFDLVVTNFSHDFNTYYRNRGRMIFSDSTFEGRFRDSFEKLCWGIKFFDFDHDGWLDVFHANGHVYPEVNDHANLDTTFKQTNSLYRNLGGTTFENVSERAGPGLAIRESTRGVVLADLDRDGDLDLAMTNMEAPPTVLFNEAQVSGNWISFRLIGSVSNRDAIGARLRLEAGGRVQLREVNPFGSFQSQSDYSVHFGLGPADNIDRVTIRWPNGESEVLTDLAAGQFVTVTEGAGITAREAPHGS